MCYKYKNSETFVNVLEYCQNGSLNNYIGKDNIIFNDTRKLNCIYGIASGRRYLHSHQFIHRNLNPRKILLDDRFIPKINDLSLAAIIDEKIVTMTNRVGIFAYMAPEMFKEDGIKISFNFEQPSKTDFPIIFIEDGSIKFSIFSHLQNAESLIDSNEDGSITFERDKQL